MPATEPVALFTQLMREWADAIANHDRAWFERSIADDFDCVTFLGTRIDKRQLIELDMTIESPSLTFREVKAQVYGDIALTETSVYIKERLAGDDSLSDGERAIYAAAGLDDEARAVFARGSEFIYSSAWRRSGGRWQCFYHHGTLVAGS